MTARKPVLAVPITVDGQPKTIDVPVGAALTLAQLQVGDFHQKFGLTACDKPTLPPQRVAAFRQRLHHEEVMNELDQAMTEEDMVGIADGIADAIYVLLGTAVTYGIDMGQVFDIVHEANMQKFPVDQGGDVKPMKPPGWQSPDVEGVLRSLGWEG